MSAKTSKSYCKKLFKTEKEDIKATLSAAKFVCTTADGWSTRIKRCIGVTAHWVKFIFNKIII